MRTAQSLNDFTDFMNPGASDDDIAAFEKSLGRSLPVNYKELLKVHNGEKFVMAMAGFAFLSMEEVLQQWKWFAEPKADYVISEFKSVFPLQNPWNKNIEECFDVCGHNYFDNKTCSIVIDRIKQTKADELKVIKFEKEVIEWLNDKLKYADYIVVYGNL